jgi:molybdopterin/thiamine biosynthesis adenylyltransferase
LRVVDDPPERLHIDLDDEHGRYHRQNLISWWQQDRLARARVLVVGAGALGNEIVKNLALAGIGTSVVIDLDVVENSNLSRCVFFRPEDEGEAKAQIVCDRAAELNSEVTFVPMVGDVRHDIGLADFMDFDVVLGGLDNREARLHVNQACWKASTPWVDGAIEGLMGTMRSFVPPDSACYECTMSQRDHELVSRRRACSLLSRDEMLNGKVPTTGTSASVVAAMQVQEAIKLMHRGDLSYGFEGRGFAYNGMTHDSYVVTYPRRDWCMSHDTYDLQGAVRLAHDAPLSEALAAGRALLDDATAVLELEHEVVLSATCEMCDTTDRIGRPLSSLVAAHGLCPRCGAERTLDMQHVFEDGHPALAGSMRDLGLPVNDVVTVRGDEGRTHFIIGSSPLGGRNGAT